MAKTRMAQVVITCNATKAKKALDEIKTHAAQLRQQYNQLAKEYDRVVAAEGKNSKTAKELASRLRYLETTSKALDSAIKRNEADLGNLNSVLKNLAGATTRQLRSALSALKKQLENTSGNEVARLKQIRAQIAAVQQQINANTGAVKAHSSAWKTTIRNITTYVGMFTGVHQAIQKVGSLIRGNLDMSDQLSQIRMVSGLAMKDVEALSDELKGLDTRSSLKELQSLAYEGSKLGMGKYGVEGLRQFTEAANQVNVALKEQLGGDTMTAMSKMVENMGLVKSMGIEKALLATGSAMFRLSSSSTATAGNIVEFAKRLVGLASTSKITTDQLLALGSASDSMFLMPEVSATAFNKILTAIQKQPRTVEKAVGLTPGTIDKLYRAGKTMDALVLIFQKMHDMGNMNAMAPLFKDLGSDGARLNQVVVSMAKHVAVLKEHLNLSKDAFSEATDVTQEYNLRQETAQGYLERANNLWQKAFVNKDGVNNVKEMTKEWYEFSRAMTDDSWSPIMAELRLSINSIFLLLKGIIYLLPFIVNGLITIGGIKAFFALKDSIVLAWKSLSDFLKAKLGNTAATAADTVATEANTAAQATNAASTASDSAAKGANAAASGAMATATDGATAATRRLTAAQKANAIGLVITMLTTLIWVIADYIKSAYEAKQQQDVLNESINDFNGKAAVAKDKLRDLVDGIKKTKVGTEARVALVRQFNSIYGTYLGYQLKETANVNELERAYRRVNEQLRSKLALEIKNKDEEALVAPRLRMYGERSANYRALGGSQEFLDKEINKGKGYRGLTWLRMFAKDAGIKLNADQFKLVYAYINQALPDGPYGLVADNGKNIRGVTIRPQMRLLHAAGSARQAYVSANKQKNKINNTWDNIIGNYSEPTETEPDTGGLTNDAAEAKAAAKARRAAAAAERARIAKAKRALNEEMKRAKEESTAVISNIEAYYNLQSKALDDLGPGGSNEQYTREEITALQAELKKRELKALSQARYAIAGKPNDFNTLRMTGMGNGVDRFDRSSRSDDLLKQIRSVDLQKAHASLAKFNGSDAVYGINAGSILDEINKNATEDEKKLQEVANKQADAIQNTMNALDDFGKLRRDMFDKMVTQGLNVVPFGRAARKVFPYNVNAESSYQSSAPGKLGPGELNGGDLANVQVTAYRPNSQHPAEDMLTAVQKMGYHPYLGGVGSDKEIYQWLRAFASNYTNDAKGKPVYTDWAKSLPDLADWLQQLDALKVEEGEIFPDEDDLKKTLDPIRKQIQMFYLDIIGYADEYYEQRKKWYDGQKKIVDEMWNRSTEKQTIDEQTRVLTNRQAHENVYGRPQNDWQPWGFSKTLRNDDTELELKKTNLQSAQQQYMLARMKDTNPTFLKQYLDKIDKAQAELEQTVAARVTDRMNTLKQWTDPIEQLGRAMGEAFATMSEDAKAGRDAVKDALKDMVAAYARSAIDIIKNLLMLKVKQNLIRRQSSKAGVDKVNALFNDNGLPTGTIENANIVVANAQMPGALASDTSGVRTDANGNTIVSTTNNTTNTPAASAPLAPTSSIQQQAAGATTQAASGIANGGSVVGSVAGAAVDSALGNAGGQLSSAVQAEVAKNKAIEDADKQSQDKRKKQEDKGNKERSRQTKAHGREMVSTNKETNKSIETAEAAKSTAMTAINDKMGSEVQKAQAEQDNANKQSVVNNAQTDTQGGIVSGAAKIIAKLGWWGIPLVAVITALLNGLLSAFLSKLGKGGSKSATTNTKLKTGMLTYDSGNVQQFRGLVDGESYPVVGNDGHVYAARSVEKAATGIVNSPIATMINGKPGLVGERGPEIVIGRETTAAMMMNRPDLIRDIVKYDKNRSGQSFRAYDAGNVQEVAAVLPDTQNDADARLTRQTLALLESTIARLNAHLDKGIGINAYGRNGAAEQLRKADDFLRRHQ